MPLFFRRTPLRLQFLQQQPGNGENTWYFFQMTYILVSSGGSRGRKHKSLSAPVFTRRLNVSIYPSPSRTKTEPLYARLTVPERFSASAFSPHQREISNFMPCAVKDSNDLEARERVAYGSTMARIPILLTSTIVQRSVERN